MACKVGEAKCKSEETCPKLQDEKEDREVCSGTTVGRKGCIRLAETCLLDQEGSDFPILFAQGLSSQL